MRSRSIGVALGALALIAACSANGDEAPERLCTPGAYVFCRCQNRDEGTKLCDPGGQSFAECLPCDASGTPPSGGGGSDGIGDHSGGTPSSDPPPTPDPDAGTPDPDAGPGPGPDSSVDDAGFDATVEGGTTLPSEGGSPTVPNKTPPTPPTTPAPAGAKHCVPMMNIAPKTEVQQIADNPPTAEGGTPKDGVYAQTWAVSYTGTDGEQGTAAATVTQQTIELMGDVGRFVYVDDTNAPTTGGFRLTSTGNKVTIAYECPAAAPKTFSFEVDGDDLTLFDAKGARFFTRQTGSAK